MTDASDWIDRLDLEPHPEGGYFSRTYTADVVVDGSQLPDHDGARPIATAIYYLLEATDFSAFHRLASDERWHFYRGDPLTLYLLDDELATIELGTDRFQAVVPAGTWFAAEASDGDHGFALVGCEVTPGFDFADFELADSTLADRYPAHRALIDQLIR